MDKVASFEDILNSYYSEDDFDYSSMINKDNEKVCPLCKKLFYPAGRNSSRQRYCGRTHYTKCPICGKPVKQQPPSDKPGSVKCACEGECSKKYRALKTKQSMIEKYGYENVSQVPEFKAKISSGLKAKSSETIRKVVATMKERYGGIGTASPAIREKIESTMKEKYGVTNPSDSPEFRAKIKEKLRSEEVVEKRKANSRKKWGTDYPTQSREVQLVMEETLMKNWGVPYAGQIPESREKARNTCLDRYGEPTALNTEESRKKARLSMIENRTGRVSKINMRFLERLKEEGIEDADTEFYIGRNSYDIVIPSRKIVIEIDPSYTHSTIPNHFGEGKDPEYHLNRTNQVVKEGFRCIHIFDWDSWDKIIPMLKPSELVYARKCDLRSIDCKKASAFIEGNHLQGDARGAKYCYGLYRQGELVSVMTFSKPRYNRNYQWELLRLCTKSGLTVVGGASKMFNQFVNEANPESIISYCDKAKFSGKVYKKLGFTLAYSSAPSKVWSKEEKYITDNLLRQRGYDQLFNTSYGKWTSNEELMLQNGWLPVYDCGQYVFEWKND